jgi:hypothetical protein
MLPVLGYTLPKLDDESREDALFHYTTATGLLGIFRERELWSSAHHCANDETELVAGKGVLNSLFRGETDRLIRQGDQRIATFYGRGVDPRQYGEHFEETLLRFAFGVLTTFVSSFCKPASREDFEHGLLSQWRGYGPDGGYAIHFSRTKLLAAIDRANQLDGLNYALQDVHYAAENPLRTEVLKHAEAFVAAYNRFLDHLAEPLDSRRRSAPNPLAGLTGGPLEALLDYLIHTKSSHFGEERECRLSLIEARGGGTKVAVSFFVRGGVLVPYAKTPPTFNVLECIESIVIGPGPRMDSRYESLGYLVKQSGLSIPVRKSQIPFTRF